VVIALASRSVQGVGGLTCNGQVSQWAFGLAGVRIPSPAPKHVSKLASVKATVITYPIQEESNTIISKAGSNPSLNMKHLSQTILEKAFNVPSLHILVTSYASFFLKFL
jgi:hypothetical protein